MLRFAFELLIGKYAEISAGALGILGSLALAIPPIESGNVRNVLLQIEEIETSISGDAFQNAKRALTTEARRLIRKERLWNLIGSGLLLCAFLVLLMHSINSAMNPTI